MPDPVSDSTATITRLPLDPGRPLSAEERAIWPTWVHREAIQMLWSARPDMTIREFRAAIRAAAELAMKDAWAEQVRNAASE